MWLGVGGGGDYYISVTTVLLITYHISSNSIPILVPLSNNKTSITLISGSCATG